MKIAITGKGGVGKTTVAALLAVAFRQSGCRVVAIDADPNANLLACMGYGRPDAVRPLVELKDLIEERTGARPGGAGGMFKLNPCVDDIPAKYGVDVAGIKVLVAGAVKRAGSGCYCPENAFVRALVSHLLLDGNTTLLLDMEAGIEHLTRGTASAVNRLFIVVEPGMRSVETARRIEGLAAELGLRKASLIANKVRSEAEKTFLRESIPGVSVAGFVPYDAAFLQAEQAGRPVFGVSPAAERAIAEIVRGLLHGAA